MKVLFSNLFYIYDEWKYSIIIITEIHYYKRHIHLISSQKVSQCIIDVKVVPEMGQVSRFTIQFHINFPYKCSLLEPHSSVRDTFDRSHTKIKINTSIKRMEFERSRKNALRFEILWKSHREIGRRSFMYDFCGRKTAYPSLTRSVFLPHLRVTDSHRIKLRRFVPHMCPDPMSSPSPWKLLNGMIDILPIQSVKRDTSWRGFATREEVNLSRNARIRPIHNTIHTYTLIVLITIFEWCAMDSVCFPARLWIFETRQETN